MLSLRSKIIINYIVVGLIVVIFTAATALIGINRIRRIALQDYDECSQKTNNGRRRGIFPDWT